MPDLGQQLWVKPVYSHSDDEEFEASKLDSSWLVYDTNGLTAGSLSYGAVDVYDSLFTSGPTIRVEVNGLQRRSWALFQAPVDSRLYHVYKSYTAPTNMLIVARMKFLHTNVSATNNDKVIGLGFLSDSGGYPDVNSYVIGYLNQSGASIVQARYIVRVSGSTVHTANTIDIDAQGQAIEYVAIHKIGTTYHGYFGTASGNWIYMGSATQSASVPYFGILLRNATSTDPGAGVFGVDFIRYYETDNFLL